MPLSIAKVFLTQFSVTLPVVSLLYFAASAEDLTDKELWKMALKSALMVAGILGGCLLLGKALLNLFTIPHEMFQGAGGLVLMLMGAGFVLGVKQDFPTLPLHKYKHLVFFPLTFPLTIGPTPMYIAVSMSTGAESMEDWVALVLGQVLCVLLIFLLLSQAKKIVNRIGVSGVQLAQQFVGYVFIAVGMEMFLMALLAHLKLQGVY